MSAGWIEFVVTGPRGEPAGFLRGWLAARGLGEAVLDAESEGFDCEPVREKFRELLRPSVETAHLLVRANARAAASEAFARQAAPPAMAVVSERPVFCASFGFQFVTWSEEQFARLRRLFLALPPGVTLSPGTGFSETREPDADPAGAYAPVHEYRGTGRGACEGPVEAVLPLWRACSDEELIQAHAPVLVYEESPADPS